MRYLFGDIIPDAPIDPQGTYGGATPSRDALSPVHPRDTVRFPFVPPRWGLVQALYTWWQSCFAALPADPDGGVHYLCPVRLPFARGAPQPAPCAPSDEPASAPPARAPLPAVSGARHAEVDDDRARHILELRQVFGQSAMIDGVTRERHRGIELVRGSATVRCRACGQDIARRADLADATAEDEPLYEYTPAGLRACPATSTASEATDGERGAEEPAPPMPIALSHARGPACPAPRALRGAARPLDLTRPLRPVAARRAIVRGSEDQAWSYVVVVPGPGVVPTPG